MAKALYKVILEMTDGQKYESKGKTVFDALDKLELSYLDVKTKGTLTLEYGKKTSSRLFYLKPLRRVVVNKLRKAQVAKDLEYLLA